MGWFEFQMVSCPKLRVDLEYKIEIIIKLEVYIGLKAMIEFERDTGE